MSEPTSIHAVAATPLSIAEREQTLLAPWAMHTADSQGRRHGEPAHAYRGLYQRDRDRIVHSTAYRRLSGKTQVFTGELGDYHRTRLTHTIEVTSIARTLARAMRLNEDLVESLAMFHDLGHPPFGHAGEDVLDECLQAHGGFSHNRHALRIVEELEQRYVEFPGLNLSIEVLSGQRHRIDKRYDHERPLLEVQAVDAADSMAYDAHDADDALELKLISLAELAETPLWRTAVERVRSRYHALTDRELQRSVVHELIDWQVSDVLRHSLARIEQFGVVSVAAVRSSPLIIEPGAELIQQKQELEQFLYQRVYRHPAVLKVRRRAQAHVLDMFHGYVRHPEWIPEGFRGRIATEGLERTVGDYLAGMTDRYCRQQYRLHFARS